MSAAPVVKATYFLEVVSSWCHWAEPAWSELKSRFAGQVEFNWKIALMDASGLPTSRAQCEWFYRRSGLIVGSPYMLNSGWYEDGAKEYPAPNLVAEAARDFGVNDDRARLALAHAAVREGLKVGRWEVAAEVAARATGLDATALLANARTPEIEARARASTAEFHALQVTQRPTFVLESRIGDKAVFSGTWQAAPLIGAIDAMLADAAAYAAHAAHFGGPPPQ
jgi:predicted DsbA family dithiol-disulfide isomerase